MNKEYQQKGGDMPNGEQGSGYKWWILVMVCLVQIFVIGTMWMCIPVLFGEMMAQNGWTIGQLMAAWGAIPLAIIFTNFPAGIIGDKFGIRWVIGLGIVAIAVVGAARGLVSSFTMFYVTMLAYGVVFPFAMALMPKALGSYFPPEQLGMANGVGLGAYGLGAAGALQFSGTLISPAIGGYKNVILLYAGICLVVGILWLLTVKEPPPAPVAADAGPAPSLMQLLIGLIKNPQVLVICVMYFMFLGGWIGMAGVYPSLGVAARGLTHGQAAFPVTLALLVYVGGCFVFPTISDKMGLRRPIYSICLLISGFGMFMTAVTSGYTMILVWAAVWGLTAGAIPIIFAVPFEMPSVGLALGGAAIGLILAAGNVGGFLFPTIIGKFSGGDPATSLLYVGILCGLFGYSGTGLVIWLVHETGPKAQKAAG
ncbi:nitrate/nitrite transporter [Thermodesulfobacteriota bacterium]